MVVFCWEECCVLNYLSCDWFVELLADVFPCFFSHLFLLFVVVVDCCGVLESSVAELSAFVRWIDVSPELVQYFFVGDY